MLKSTCLYSKDCLSNCDSCDGFAQDVQIDHSFNPDKKNLALSSARFNLKKRGVKSGEIISLPETTHPVVIANYTHAAQELNIGVVLVNGEEPLTIVILPHAE